MSETNTPEAPWLNGAERGILTHFGHLPDADFNEEKLARRVLELPNTSDHWFTASAVTLAAAYLDPKRLAAPELYEALLRAAEVFREYENLHRAKGTPEGEAKARTNAREAELCEAALSKANGKD